MKRTNQQSARRIAAELHTLEARGAKRARELSARIQAGVIGAYRRRETPQFAERFIAIMQPVLAETLQAAYLTGARRSELTLAGRIKPRIHMGGDGAALSDGLALGIFDKTLKFLRRVLDADLPTIEAQADTQALRALRTESVAIEQQVQRTVATLIQEGSHVRNGIEVLRQTFDRLGVSGQSDWRLETIFRTQTQIAYGAGRYEAYSDPAVDEILWGYEYTTAGDDRVRPEHEAMDGVRWRKDDPRLMQWWPPNGWNCVTGDTLVSGQVDGASRMYYSGPMIEIRTANGRVLSITPNHRVATLAGFRASQTLREGDDLFDDRCFVNDFVDGIGNDVLSAPTSLRRNENEDHRPSAIQDVFQSLATSGRSPVGSMGLPLDFHGDAKFGQSKIDVVRPNRVLPCDIADAEIMLQQLGEFRLQLAALASQATRKSACGLGSFRDASFAATAGVPRFAALLFQRFAVALARLANRPLGSLRIGPSADLDAVLGKPAGECGAADSNAIGQLFDRFAGRVTRDKIIGIRRYEFTGHVYDLQCATGYMVANGIVISNCRCQLIPIFVDDEPSLTSPREPEPMLDGFAPQPDKGFAFNPSLAIAGRVTVAKPAEPTLAP